MEVRKLFIILHNIRSAHNVGSVFRSADGAGVSKIYLTGYTPTPQDRFGRVQKEITKTSLGAVETVPYACVPDIEGLMRELKRDGVDIVAVEQTDRAISYRDFMCTRDTAFVFGNEVTGIENEILAHIESHVDIPMSGTKESLNVSVCAGIILFHFRS